MVNCEWNSSHGSPLKLTCHSQEGSIKHEIYFPGYNIRRLLSGPLHYCLCPNRIARSGAKSNRGEARSIGWAEEEPQARSEYRRLSNGETISGTIYKTRAQARLNRTYALRGIHYSDSDVLVAFRIIRKDDDDSVIILWKLLKKYPKPELARNN